MLAVTRTRRAPCARAQSFGAERSDLSRPRVALETQVMRQAPRVTPEPAQTFRDVCRGCPAGARAPDPGMPHTPGTGPQHASRAHAGSSPARYVQCCQHGSMNCVPGCTLTHCSVGGCLAVCMAQHLRRGVPGCASGRTGPLFNVHVEAGGDTAPQSFLTCTAAGLLSEKVMHSLFCLDTLGPAAPCTLNLHPHP